MSTDLKQQSEDVMRKTYAALRKADPLILQLIKKLQDDLAESCHRNMACIHRIDMLTDELADARRKLEQYEPITQKREPQ